MGPSDVSTMAQCWRGGGGGNVNVMLDPVSPWRSTTAGESWTRWDQGQVPIVNMMTGPSVELWPGTVSLHRGIAAMRTNEGIKLPSVPSQPPGSSQGPGAELTPVTSVQAVPVSAPVFSNFVLFIPSLISDLHKDTTMNM